VLPGVVLSHAASAHPGHMLIECQCGSTRIVARITSRSFDALRIAPDMHIWLQVKSVSLV